ncbi:hypothetical protein TNCV_96381 [Trichonephila clavipes]|nr:hypothetical protein TNCV_96381 [Trichonephila clavipes]
MGDLTYAENADVHYMYGRVNGDCRATLRIHDAGRQRAVRSPSLDESILNVVAVRPESRTSAVAHHASASLDHLDSVKRKSLTLLPFSASTSFESGRLSSPTASGWYNNVSCSWTS